MIVDTDSFDKGGASEVCAAGGGDGHGVSGPTKVSRMSFGKADRCDEATFDGPVL